MSESPYEKGTLQFGGRKKIDWVARTLQFILLIIALLITACLCIQIDLYFSYPGLSDPSAGPFSYWPSDAFSVLTVVSTGTSVGFFYFGLLLLLRKRSQNKR
jgi:hypothetical protein